MQADRQGQFTGQHICQSRRPFRGVDDLELVTRSWVHWFNNDRPYSSIGYQTPIEHENEYAVKTSPDSNRCRENPPSRGLGLMV
jgi:transposase InsO family protein